MSTRPHLTFGPAMREDTARYVRDCDQGGLCAGCRQPVRTPTGMSGKNDAGDLVRIAFCLSCMTQRRSALVDALYAREREVRKRRIYAAVDKLRARSQR